MSDGVEKIEPSLVTFAPDVAIEPTVDGWAAWLFLLDPIGACFYRQRHVALLRSYVANPERHAKAVLDTRLAGGSFCDLGSVNLDQVRRYLAWYEDVSQPMIRFGEALNDLQNELVKCDSLPAYGALPAELRGRVELRRSDDGRPSMRILRGPHASRPAIGAAMWQDGRRRPSFGSTPRLADDPRMQVGEGAAGMLAALMDAYHRPCPADALVARAAALGLRTEGIMSPVPPPDPGAGAATFLGHASVALRLRGGRLVSDPVPPSSSPTARGLDDVRVVVISHGHPDHFSPEALLSLVAQQPTVVVPRNVDGSRFDASLANGARVLGFTSVIELGPYETFETDEVRLTALPFLGEHGNLPIHAKAAFHVETDQFGVVLAADATGLDPAVFNRDIGGRVDALVIGIEPAGARAGWLYGPLLAAAHRQRHMADEPLAGATAEEVLEIARTLGARQVRIYGTGAPGMEHILGRSSGNASRALSECARLRAMAVAADLDILVLRTPGEDLRLGDPR
ncbi:MBL fold metallo-hydrolase [Dactylosporangium sp. NPDC050588]|uniref:MBL fold metallo-hydrolase n=1 Tax=Dactylosporangium sp. NPDC050588 TaxID=3157211 RepID=UPI0033E17787